MNDIIGHKIATILHSLVRIREVYHLAKNNLDTDLTSQDSIIFNLQRACQACVDLANHLNRKLFSEFPEDSRDSFELLKKAGLISAPLALNLQKIVGLRNIAVHDYQTLNLDIVKHLVEHRLSDFEEFVKAIKSLNLSNLE